MEKLRLQALIGTRNLKDNKKSADIFYTVLVPLSKIREFTIAEDNSKYQHNTLELPKKADREEVNWIEVEMELEEKEYFQSGFITLSADALKEATLYLVDKEVMNKIDQEMITIEITKDKGVDNA